MSIQVRVTKASSIYPQVGRVLMVESTPRVRVLIAKGYLTRTTTPVFNPVILDEPDIEVPVLVDDHQIEDETPVDVAEDAPVERVEIGGFVEDEVPVEKAEPVRKARGRWFVDPDVAVEGDNDDDEAPGDV